MLLAAIRIAVSGVLRSWLSEASSAVLSCSLCRVNSASLPLFEKFSAFNGDRDDAGEGVERAWLHRPAGGGKNADRVRS